MNIRVQRLLKLCVLACAVFVCVLLLLKPEHQIAVSEAAGWMAEKTPAVKRLIGDPYNTCTATICRIDAGSSKNLRMIPLLVRLLDHKNYSVMEAAFNKLVEFGSNGIPTLCGTLKEGNESERFNVVLVLGCMTNSAVRLPLESALDDPSPRVREAAHERLSPTNKPRKY